MRQAHEGRCANFFGNYRFDSFANDYIFEPDAIEYIDKINALKDEAKEKRVELHMHSKLSEMDGVSSPSEIVTAAYEMGHRAVAITDHLCLQGYHEAYMAHKTYNGLPIFEATIGDNPEAGINKISLVDYPAVESDFLSFAKKERKMNYAIQNEEKRLVRGVIMRADFPIYRNNEQGEYYVKVS